jgi:hypothetical protein
MCRPSRLRPAVVFVSLVIAALVAESRAFCALDNSDLWYFTFRVQNTTGRQVRVRISENGQPIVNVQVPRSTMEINAPEGTVDPNPRGVVSIRVPLHQGSQTLEVDELSYFNFHESFPIRNFTERPDLDFDVAVSRGGVTLTQSFEMPDDLTAEEKLLPVADQRARLALERRAHPNFHFLLVNRTGKTLNVQVLADGKQLFAVAMAAERPADSPSDPEEPNWPHRREVVPFNVLTRLLEVREEGFKLDHRFLLDPTERPTDREFRIVFSKDGIELSR